MKVSLIYIQTIFLLKLCGILAEQYADDAFAERARCADEEETSNRDKSNQNAAPYNLYQPRQRFDVYEKHPNNQIDTNKRSLEPTFEDNPPIHKRQVGVVYGNGKPIGILQPYQESYKFIPVKDEGSINGIDKREAVHPAVGDYPAILADFRIQQANKVPQTKREYKQIKNDPKEMDKMRILRSSANTVQIEDKLKNILDDMGLAGEENHEKRQAEVVNKASRKKREKVSTTTEDNSSSNPLKREGDYRQKREKEENDKLQENFEVSVDSKVPVKSSIETRDSENTDDDSDYEKRMERQIKDKISALKEEVKRQIHVLKDQDQEQEEEENQRKKRQANNMNLIELENDFIDPLRFASEDGMKPLVRKRRLFRKKRDLDEQNIPETNANRKKRENFLYKRSLDELQKTDEPQSPQEDSALRRDVDLIDYQDRRRRSDLVSEDYYIDDERTKRGNIPNYDDMAYLERGRRRIEEPVLQNVNNKPQQLTDMSELDLFGALPKNYDGELSRFKRIKRNKDKN